MDLAATTSGASQAGMAAVLSLLDIHIAVVSGSKG